MYVPDRFSLKSSRVQDGMGLYTARRVAKVGDPAARAPCPPRAPSAGPGRRRAAGPGSRGPGSSRAALPASLPAAAPRQCRPLPAAARAGGGTARGPAAGCLSSPGRKCPCAAFSARAPARPRLREGFARGAGVPGRTRTPSFLASFGVNPGAAHTDPSLAGTPGLLSFLRILGGANHTMFFSLPLGVSLARSLLPETERRASWASTWRCARGLAREH